MIDLTFEEYQEYLKSDEWKERRKELKEICESQCMRCGAKGKIAHHLTYEHVLCESIDELEFLCEDCHDRAHMMNEVYVPHFARRYNKNGEYICLT